MQHKLGGNNRGPPSHTVQLLVLDPHCGDTSSIYFRTMGDCCHYTRSYSELRKLIIELNCKLRRHEINNTEYCNALRWQWLPDAYSFISQVGADLVLQELCDLVNHAETLLNLPITDWAHYTPK